MGLATRDRNLLKIAVALPAVVGCVGWSVHIVLRSLGIERSPALSAIGAVAALYLFRRVRIATRRASRENSTLFLERECRNKALVTGCTSGLGKAFAEGLRRRGVGLVLASRDAEKLRALKAFLEATYPTGQPIEIVVHDFSTRDRKFYCEKHFSGVGLVVNNVGVGTEDPLRIDEVSPEAIDGMIAVNCAATTHMCRAALPALAEQGGGVVVNVSSGSAAQPTPHLAVYAATKAFVAHLSRSLDREWRSTKRVRVLCIAPYYISGTGLFASERSTFNAPPAKVVVDGTLRTLATPALRDLELTYTNPAHAFIAFLFTCIAEDPVLGPLARLAATFGNFNASMLMVMTKARARFVANKNNNDDAHRRATTTK
ncbi:hypothetical protein CTAYLR_001742 [Chrysophaeum taylorii]|uniref:Uncharacterized protein n=1 Tax=Chrysophaeum taylorii TaxID=2483200 RepID=A0AAD7XMC4_9STRA|nr:hypothetical protein CTAYLR_001742 [Chrysophaeum taylorii]